MSHDIYDFEAQLEGTIRLIENSDISDNNKKLLFKYRDHLLKKGKKKKNGKDKGLSKGRVAKLLKNARKIIIWHGKDFKAIPAAGKEKIEDEIDALEVKKGRHKGERISAWTWRDYKLALRGLLEIIGKRKLAESVNASVDIEDGGDKYRDIETKHPEDMLTEDDIIALIKGSLNPRDKALVAMAFDIGPRPHEIGRLTIKDVKITKEGGTVTIPDRSKTGRRCVPIVFSIPYVYLWLRSHPLKDDKSAPLWVGLDKRTFAKPMMYPAIRKAILSIARRANLEKRVHAYLFRHSSATHAAAHGSSEFQMDAFYGWTYGSKHPQTYIKMVGRDTKTAQDNRYGIKPKEEAPKSKLTPKKCPRCEWFNELDAENCFTCGSVLDIAEAIREEELERKRGVYDEVLNVIMEDEKIQDRIKQLKKESPEFIERAERLSEILG